MPVYCFKCTECGAEKEIICEYDKRPDVIECNTHWRKNTGDERMTMVHVLSTSNFVINGFNEKNGYSGENNDNL